VLLFGFPVRSYGMVLAEPVLASTCSLPGCGGSAAPTDSGAHRLSAVGLAGDPSPGSGIPGALMTCLALLVAVLTVMVGRAGRRLPARGLVRTPQAAAATCHPPWPVPSLAELCVLRT
jgi:hypothetical protein